MCCASLLFIVVVVTTTESVNVITNFVQYILCYIIPYYASASTVRIVCIYGFNTSLHKCGHMHLLSLKTHTCYIVYIAINNIQESCNAQGQKRLPVVITI